MQKKIIIFLEIIFIFVAMFYYFIKEVVPEYRMKYGSSDTVINSSRYQNMIEFNIDNMANFALIIDSSKKTYHIMFFDKGSIVLYNKNIENNESEFVTEQIIRLLIENDILTSQSIIEIIRYDDFSYDDYLMNIKNSLSKYNLNNSIIESVNTLDNKSFELGLGSFDNNDSLLSYMDYYSKEIQRKYKNIKDLVNNTVLNKDTSIKLSNNVYKKIEEYVYNNKIDNLDKDNTLLLISTIPADSNSKYYPSSNSWYYVSNGEVYSYIELSDEIGVYGYCYRGSIDLRSEGEC